MNWVKKLRLTQTTHGAGCGCKIGPRDLDQALCSLPFTPDVNLIAGMLDDAGVYKLREDLAIIQTVDYFTPIVDDPFTFGQVAVANALSDVYAMGGKPILAMNIVCFPINKIDISILQEILRGGMQKMQEAGVLLVGGHSVEDDEIKYGLSVTGIVHPEKVWIKKGARKGDKLILTKPLGTGIINTAVKGGMASKELETKSIRAMMTLNKETAETMAEAEVHACTDISGFGFLGHLREMIEKTDVGMVIYSSSIPFFPEIREFAEMGLVPGGLRRNREFGLSVLDVDPRVADWMIDILFDPQTSGGLLFSIPSEQAEQFLKRLHETGVKQAAIVGEVVKEPKGKIVVK